MSNFINYIIKAPTKEEVLGVLSEYLAPDEYGDLRLTIPDDKIDISVDIPVYETKMVVDSTTGAVITPAVRKPDFYALVRIRNTETELQSLIETLLAAYIVNEDIGIKWSGPDA